MGNLDLLDISVCGAYIVLVFALAVRSARSQETNDDYFLGGRRMNWFVVGISMFATSFSSISFLGIPQRGAYQDFSFYLTLLLILFVITPILWFVFVPMYVRGKVSSGYEYLGRRFGIPVQRFGSVLYCVYAIGWMGAMLYAVALTLQAVMGLGEGGYLVALVGIGICATIYTVMGGLKAVIWTDVLQAGVLGGAVIIIMLLAINKIEGGWESFRQIAGESDKFRMIHLEGNIVAVENFTEKNSVFTAIAYALFMYLPGYTVAQNMIQRYVCAGSLKRGRSVVVLSGVINVVLGFAFLLVGTAIFVFYNQPGSSGLPVAGVDIVKEDQVLPYFVSTQLSGYGLAGLVLAGLFAAAMSTIDSGINGVCSVIVYDWLGDRSLSVKSSRLLTAALGLTVIAAALFVPVLGNSIIDIINSIASIALGILLAVFLLGMFIPWANSRGVYAGLAAGFVCLIIVWNFTDIPKWWIGAFTIIPTFLAGMTASKIFPARPGEVIDDTLLFKAKGRQ